MAKVKGDQCVTQADRHPATHHGRTVRGARYEPAQGGAEAGAARAPSSGVPDGELNAPVLGAGPILPVTSPGAELSSAGDPPHPGVSRGFATSDLKSQEVERGKLSQSIAREQGAMPRAAATAIEPDS